MGPSAPLQAIQAMQGRKVMKGMYGRKVMKGMPTPMKTKTAMTIGAPGSPPDAIGVPTHCKMVDKLWLMIPRGVLEDGLP